MRRIQGESTRLHRGARRAARVREAARASCIELPCPRSSPPRPPSCNPSTPRGPTQPAQPSSCIVPAVSICNFVGPLPTECLISCGSTGVGGGWVSVFVHVACFQTLLAERCGCGIDNAVPSLAAGRAASGSAPGAKRPALLRGDGGRGRTDGRSPFEPTGWVSYHSTLHCQGGVVWRALSLVGIHNSVKFRVESLASGSFRGAYRAMVFIGIATASSLRR